MNHERTSNPSNDDFPPTLELPVSLIKSTFTRIVSSLQLEATRVCAKWDNHFSARLHREFQSEVCPDDVSSRENSNSAIPFPCNPAKKHPRKVFAPPKRDRKLANHFPLAAATTKILQTHIRICVYSSTVTTNAVATIVKKFRKPGISSSKLFYHSICHDEGLGKNLPPPRLPSTILAVQYTFIHSWLIALHRLSTFWTRLNVSKGPLTDA